MRAKLSLTLLLSVVIVMSTTAKQITCQNKSVTKKGYQPETIKICSVIYTQSIDSPRVTIKNIDDSVTALHIIGNAKISFLPVKVDESFKNLLFYAVNHCAVRTIARINFANLTGLVGLGIVENHIERIDADSFDDLTSLQYLDLANNQIKQMNGEAIIRLTKLKDVSLTRNYCIDRSFEDFEEADLVMVARIITERCGFREASAENAIDSDRLFNFPCGEVFFNQGYVVGGNETVRGQWPFIVALFSPQTDDFFCGGVLIAPQHVLTAAHCIQDKGSSDRLSADEVTVVLGQHNIKAKSESGSVRRNVSDIFVNPAWDSSSLKWDADIAILLLDEPVTFEMLIQPVCVPNKLSIEKYEDGIVVGWGKSESNELHESIPRQASIKSVNDSLCYTADHKVAQVSSLRTFCAGGDKAGPCSGDSGSGFFVKVGSVWTLRGIVSSSMLKTVFTCDVEHFAIYTKIIDFTDWIKSVVVVQ